MDSQKISCLQQMGIEPWVLRTKPGPGKLLIVLDATALDASPQREEALQLRQHLLAAVSLKPDEICLRYERETDGDRVSPNTFEKCISVDLLTLLKHPEQKKTVYFDLIHAQIPWL